MKTMFEKVNPAHPDKVAEHNKTVGGQNKWKLTT